MLESVEEKAMVQFLERFDDNPLRIHFQDHEYQVGTGQPVFTVDFKKPIPVSRLLTSTSLALGEAYMDGDLEIEGNLYNALDHFLGQMGKFSTDEGALKKLIHTSLSKKNQEGKEKELEFATVQVPSVLPRIVPLPHGKDGSRNVILLEEIIERNMQQLFLSYDIVCA